MYINIGEKRQNMDKKTGMCEQNVVEIRICILHQQVCEAAMTVYFVLPKQSGFYHKLYQKQSSIDWCCQGFWQQLGIKTTSERFILCLKNGSNFIFQGQFWL